MKSNKTPQSVVARGRGKPAVLMPNPYIEFGYTPSNIRYLARSLNLNVSDIAKLMEVHLRTAQRWWADNGNMKTSEWTELLKRVGVDESQPCDTLNKRLRILVMGEH